jgi:signal transduction histidine kinase
MNLMLNSIEAMKSMNAPGKLTTKSQQDDSGQLVNSVMDTGVGFHQKRSTKFSMHSSLPRLKAAVWGCRLAGRLLSHAGRLWAVSNPESGATFHFTLPIRRNAHQAA